MRTGAILKHSTSYRDDVGLELGRHGPPHEFLDMSPRPFDDNPCTVPVQLHSDLAVLTLFVSVIIEASAKFEQRERRLRGRRVSQR